MPLVYRKHPRKTRGLAMPPLALGVARLGRFRRGLRRSRPCRGAGRRACSPRGRWCSEFWRGSTLRRRMAATGGDGRGGRNSGECDARVEPQAMLGAPRGPMDGARVIWWLGRHGTSARWRRRPWRAVRQGWEGSAWHAQGRAVTLIRRSTDARTAGARVRRDGKATRARLKTRHIGARTPRDTTASVSGASGCAWRGCQCRPARGRVRRRGVAAPWPEHFADPLFEIK
jgi:hypothetical protein